MPSAEPADDGSGDGDRLHTGESIGPPPPPTLGTRRRGPLEEEQLVEGKVFVDLTFAGGGVNGGGRGASSTGSTSSTQQQGSRGRGHWDNQVQEVIKSTRFLVNQVAAKVDKKEGDKLRIYSSKGRPGGR